MDTTDVQEVNETSVIDPSSVHASWSSYFSNLENGMSPSSAFSNPPSIQVGQTRAAVPVESSDGTKCLHMIYAFQEKGHKIADLDPLNLSNVAAIDALDRSEILRIFRIRLRSTFEPRRFRYGERGGRDEKF